MRGNKVDLALGSGIVKNLLSHPGITRKWLADSGVCEDLNLLCMCGDFLLAALKGIGCRFLDNEVVIQIPALKRPTLKEVQKSWSFIRGIERDDSTEEAVTLCLATVLKSMETDIGGNTYERRLLALRSQRKLLGFQHRQWLLENQQQFPALMALVGKIYIDFPGIIVVSGHGYRSVPYVRNDGGQFVDRWYWLASGFGGSGRIAVSSK